MKRRRLVYKRGVAVSVYEFHTFSEGGVVPFGTISGVKTNLGVVAMLAFPLKGYFWSEEDKDWVVHAMATTHCERRNEGGGEATAG